LINLQHIYLLQERHYALGLLALIVPQKVLGEGFASLLLSLWLE
jgi:hypothetical protein